MTVQVVSDPIRDGAVARVDASEAVHAAQAAAVRMIREGRAILAALRDADEALDCVHMAFYVQRAREGRGVYDEVAS